MNPTLKSFLDLLDLERIETNIFRGQNRFLGMKRVFGGQVLSQALIAAGRTVEEDRPAHSLHAYFLLPGDLEVPIIYQVERLRDGGSFTTRRVTAIQHGRPIFNCAISFHRHETGMEHQSSMAVVPAPDDLPSETELANRLGDRLPDPLRGVYTAERPIEWRPIDPINPFDPKPREPAVNHAWIRAVDVVPGGPLMQQAVLAYASDYNLLGASLLPHGRSFLQGTLQAASLDHALWFHRPFDVHDWLLFTTESPSASGALGFTRGTLHTADGRLIASVAQEGLIRDIDPERQKRS